MDCCNFASVSEKGLDKHMREKHDVYKGTRRNFLCNLCSLQFISSQKLIDHLNKVHYQGINVQKFKFFNNNEYLAWLDRLLFRGEKMVSKTYTIQVIMVFKPNMDHV